MNPSLDAGQRSLPSILAAILDALQVPVPSAALRALAAAALPDRKVNAEALGRIAAYSQDSYLRTKGTPRFAWVLDADGGIVRPRIWARGSWRLARRIYTDAAESHWTIVLAAHLCRRMVEGTREERDALGAVSLETVGSVLGPRGIDLPGERAEWAMLAEQVARRLHPTGPAHPLSDQTAAETRLEARGLPTYSLYFGANDTTLSQAIEAPPGLRLPAPGETGTPFDELVLERAAGDRSQAREVLAFIQEWGALIDGRVEGAATLEAYAERWEVDLATAKQRNDQFRSFFPGESSPSRVWELLWQARSNESLPRLLGKEIVEREALPSVLSHFVNHLADRMRDTPGLAKQVLAAALTFDEASAPPAGQEQRRFFALCERARQWSALALASSDQPQRASGALSLEPIFDESSAAYAQGMMGEYRRELPQGPSRQLLLYSQRAMRVAATLDALHPPRDATAFLDGTAYAAAALAEARHEDLQIDLVAEARSTVRILEATQ